MHSFISCLNLKITPMFLSLPPSSYLLIDDCLREVLEFTLKTAHRSTVLDKGWRNLLQVSNHPKIIELKRKFIYYPLNLHISKEFLKDNEFRFDLLSKLDHPSQQVSLSITAEKMLTKAISLSSFLHGITYTGYKSHVKADLQTLASLAFIRLGNVSFRSLELATIVKNRLQYLNIHLYFYEIPERIISTWKSLKRISVSYCPKLGCISALSTVPDLTLSYCNGIKDVSNLGKQRKLTLSGCVYLDSITSLSSVYELDISYCTSIRDISSLKDVMILKMKGILPERGLPYENTIKEITISDHLFAYHGMNLIVSSMDDQRKLILSQELDEYDDNYTDDLDLSSLSSYQRLTIVVSTKGKRRNVIFPLSLEVKRLELKNVQNIILSDLKKLSLLILKDCTIKRLEIASLSSLSHVSLERTTSCNHERIILGISGVTSVYLKDCDNIE
jgi:hypothetical protein